MALEQFTTIPEAVAYTRAHPWWTAQVMLDPRLAADTGALANIMWDAFSYAQADEDVWVTFAAPTISPSCEDWPGSIEFCRKPNEEDLQDTGHTYRRFWLITQFCGMARALRLPPGKRRAFFEQLNVDAMNRTCIRAGRTDRDYVQYWRERAEAWQQENHRGL